MRTILGLALTLLFFVTACKKDDGADACMKLEGTWAADSWLEDDEQFFGDTIFITSSVIEFKTLVDTLGDINWTISYTLGGDISFFGSYVVNASCDEVIITPKSGSPTTYNFSFDGDKLILETNDNNVHVVQEYLPQ